ncbi:RodZ domain-containing protein [Stutzerimonas azotifigens]|uniref:RodZ domain-containing protein n=1 Tax=Stutzerimonas azotifigens TaxID=291995 RepID=UPI000429F4F1|nr:RodZ family helix-turn-helix domain-containing protein [Stutzerimonas azotifigens]
MKTPSSEHAAPIRTNPGETLRDARESRGLSLATVAQQLNLSERSLSQIEAGDFSQMPGHTFARGYVRAYAKLLELDQARLVAEFDQYTGTNAAGASVHSLGRIEEPVRLSHSVLRFFTFILLVVLAVAGFLWWQDQPARQASEPVAIEHIEVEGADGTTQIHALDLPEDQAAAEGQGPDPLTPPLVPEPGAEGDEDAASAMAMPEGSEENPVAAAPGEAPVAPDVAQDQAPPADASPAAQQGEPALTQAPATEQAAAAPAAEAAPEAGQARLSMNFTADCWVRIVDASGEVLLGRLVRQGASHAVTGQPPLDVHLGYAPGVQMSFNGEPVNLTQYTRGQTARFKLGQ